MSDAATQLAARVRHLQEVTAKATIAPTIEEIARVLVEEGVAALGGFMGALWIVDGDALVVSHWIGGVGVGPYARLPLDAETPLAHVIRTGRPVWLEDGPAYAAAFPASWQRITAHLGRDHLALACLPLLASGGPIAGFLCAFDGPRELPVDERVFLMTIARQCAIAIERLQLIASEQALRLRAESLVANMARLQELSVQLSTAVTVDDVAHVFLARGRAAVGAYNAGIWIAEGDVASLRAHLNYDAVIQAAFARVAPDANGLPLARCLATGEPVWLEARETYRAQFTAGEAATRHMNPPGAVEAIACLPMVVDGRVLGAVGLGWSEAHAFDPAERELLLLMVRHAAQAVARARMYAAEAAARRDAEAANRTKDEFLAMLGHELRNPLAPIVTALQVMRDRDPEAFPRERAIVERQTNHLVRLVDDLLDVSKIARGKIALRRAPMELAAAVAQAIEATGALVEERGHALTVDVPGGLVVDGDLDRVAQVIANLVTNAARYTPRGGRIAIAAARDGDMIRTSVRDTGPGIAPALMPHLFEPFVQGERRVDRAEGGLGLGLAIVKNLVEQHGGRAVATNPTGGGAELAVWLPAASAATPASPYVSGVRALVETPRRALRILVVDDNVDAADMLGDLLRVFGHAPTVVHDAAAALALGDPAPDLAFLDIGLPEIDGYELARRLRARPDFAAAPLVALTGYGQASDRASSRAAGFSEHLVKPVDIAKLRAILDAVAAR